MPEIPPDESEQPTVSPQSSPDLSHQDNPTALTPSTPPEPAKPVNTGEFNSPELRSFDPQESLSKKGGHKSWLIALVIVIVLIAAGAVIYAVKHHSNKTVSTKKDIPYLSYGFSGSGDIPEIYPIESGDDNNTIFLDSQLFEGLVGYMNETKIVPMLATSWYNPNDTTWVFNLRHNVHFHSGRLMTATDVAYSLNYAIAHQDQGQDATAMSFASAIKKVQIINPYQVEVTTNSPDAVLLNQLVDLYIINSKVKPGNPNAGTGPYTVQGDYIGPNANSVNLLAFNDYWGGHVYTREVHIQEDATPNQLAEDVANGKIDFAGDFDAAQQAIIKAKYKNYQQIKVPDLGVSFLELNTEVPTSPLHYLAARQAIAYAVNTAADLKAGGLLGTQASQLIPLSIPGYNPAIKDINYDPAKAKQLLAGVPNIKNPITLVYPTGDGGQVLEIAKELQAVGFNVKTSEIGSVNTLVDMELSGQGDIFYLTYISSTLDGLDIVNNTVYGTQDFTNTQLTDLVNQASSTFNPAARIAVLQKIESLVAADVPAVPLFTVNRVYALTKPYVVANNLPDILSDTYFWQTYQE